MEGSTAPTEIQNDARATVPFLALWGTVAVLLAIPYRIIHYGYLPVIEDTPADAAKALTLRTWSDIIVLRDAYRLDPHLGWHTLLHSIASVTGWHQYSLVLFAVIALFALVALSALPWLDRPEAWLCTLALVLASGTGFVDRFIIGRPFEISAAALMTILWLWHSRRPKKPRRADLVIMTVAIAVAVLLHGSWYLWALPIVAFALSREIEWAKQLSVAWLIGSVVGAILTDHPLDYLVESVRMGLDAFSSPHYVTTLVQEFQPLPNNLPGLAILAALAWYHVHGKHAGWWKSPPYLLACIGYVLGFSAMRFWSDWGLPAMLVAVAIEVQSALIARMRPASNTRLIVLALAGAATFLMSTNDAEGRWSNPRLQTYYLKSSDPSLQGWLPDHGGILYSAEMGVFYETFYANPDADWRYEVGFEPAMMPRQDFATYERIMLNHGNPLAYMPWIDKMRPEDRVVLHWPAQPQIAQLEWHGVGNLWIGRLPRRG